MDTMPPNIIFDSKKLLARIRYLEDNRRFIQNSLEMALSLGDFQQNINELKDPKHILQEAQKRINHLIPFDATGLYLVDQDQSDFKLAVCDRAVLVEFLANEVNWMIDMGYFARAMREKRGIIIESSEHSRKFLLHVIATHSRIRGMFVGLFPREDQKIPDTSLTFLSIIMLNAANALESLELYSLLANQNIDLEKKIREKTEALAHSKRQLHQAQKMQAIGTLAGSIAHDFNNILSPIVGYSELIIDDEPENSQVRKNLEEVLKAANRARELTQQILTFSRQNDQKHSPIKVQYIAKQAYKLLRSSIPSTIEIDLNLADNCSAILGDGHLIHQVIMNLCANAYQSMPEAGGKIEIELKEVDIDHTNVIKRTGLKPGRYLQLKVKDDGRGIKPDKINRIFEPYYTTKNSGQGIGLGLAVIYGIVKSHGGEITADSTPGAGTTFCVYLPIISRMDVKAEIVPFNKALQKNDRKLADDIREMVEISEPQISEQLL